VLCRLQALHGQQLVGRFVLQVDEAVNIGAAARERCAHGLAHTGLAFFGARTHAKRP
jgi:hypothetical protein